MHARAATAARQFGLAGRDQAQAGAVLAGQPASGLVALAPVQRTAG